jgi:dienelactone hydrolase
MPRNGYAHMVHEYYVERVRELRAARKERLASIKTPAQARAYQKEAQRAIARAFGPKPRRTALSPQVTGIIERKDYRIEKVLFESRPGCMVTGSLYVPNRLTRSAPAVVGSCGHSGTGKQEGLYQGFCQRLAMNGFVVFIIDPFNQGERDQYYGLKDRESVRACTRAHNMMGKQLDLLGEWFGAWRAWDASRALDYLLTRPEVDPGRIGLTGNSGGGTMTTWTWAFEPRFTMAAPSCFVTSFTNNLENELPADAEQYPPGVIGAGLDMADFLIARAPAPIILMGQNFDYFDRRGLRDAHEDVRRFYSVLKAPATNVDLFIGPQGHGYSVHNQEAMVRFFTQHAGIKRVRKVTTTEVLTVDDLNVTPRGEVVAAGAVPIYTQIAAKAAVHTHARKKPTTADLKKRLTKLLALPRRTDPPHHRNLRPMGIDRQQFARYAVDTEGGVRAILKKQMDTPFAHSLDPHETVHLYLPHLASETDLAEDRLAISLRKKHPLYALDVRGLGEAMPDETGDFFQAYGVDYMHNGYGMMLSESFLGRRVHDLLSTIDLLTDQGTRKVHLYGRGQGAVIALFAGLLHDRVATITLKNAPLSYRAWTQVPLVDWPNASFLRGALAELDLPDCIRALGRKVTLIQPWGPDMKPLTGKRLDTAMKDAGLAKGLVKRG